MRNLCSSGKTRFSTGSCLKETEKNKKIKICFIHLLKLPNSFHCPKHRKKSKNSFWCFIRKNNLSENLIFTSKRINLGFFYDLVTFLFSQMIDLFFWYELSFTLATVCRSFIHYFLSSVYGLFWFLDRSVDQIDST